jgi:hypothetical protein
VTAARCWGFTSFRVGLMVNYLWWQQQRFLLRFSFSSSIATVVGLSDC